MPSQPKPEPEVEVAPIVGRKKKQKKEKTTSSSGGHVTPVERQPETPVVQPPPPLPQPAKEDSSTYRHTANETTSLTEDAPPRKAAPSKNNADVDSKTKGKESTRPATATQKASTSPTSPKAADKKTQKLTPAGIFRELIDAGDIPDTDSFDFLKPATASSFRHDRNSTISKQEVQTAKEIVSKEDREALLAGKPVRKTIDGIRILLTPNGDCVRDLSYEEEERFLDLQARIRDTVLGPSVFQSARCGTGPGFRLVEGRCVPNGPPTCFPSMPGDFATDPVAKIHKEEGVYFLNQFVLSRMNVGSGSKGVFADIPNSLLMDKVRLTSSATSVNSVAPWLCPPGLEPEPDNVSNNVSNKQKDDAPQPAGRIDKSKDAAKGKEIDKRKDIDDDPFGDADTRRSAIEAAYGVLDRDKGVLCDHGGTVTYSPAPGATVGKNAPANVAKDFKDFPDDGVSLATINNNTNYGKADGSPGHFMVMNVDEAEAELSRLRREAEKVERNLNTLIKKNRRLLLGTS